MSACGGPAVAQAEEENGGEMEKRDALGGDLMCTLLAAVHFPVGDHLNPTLFPCFAMMVISSGDAVPVKAPWRGLVCAGPARQGLRAY